MLQKGMPFLLRRNMQTTEGAKIDRLADQRKRRKNKKTLFCLGAEYSEEVVVADL